MKIKIIANHLSGKGGTETVLRDLLEKLPIYMREAELSLSIIDGLPDREWLEGVSNVDIWKRISHSKIFLVSIYIRLIFLLIFSQDDIILGISPTIIYLAAKIKKIFRKKYKVVSWMHFSLESEVFKNKKRNLLFADFHLAIATGIADQFKTMQGHEDNVFVIFNPVEEQEFSIQSPSIPIFLSVGRLNPIQKNNIELINALTLLPKDIPWKVQFYGDGEARPNLEKAVKDFDLEDRVEFKGWIENPWNQITSGTALILTSIFEGFGMVLAEAISRGLPCISSDCPVGPSDIINNSNGFLYDVGDVETLADKMMLFINNKTEFSDIKSSISNFYELNYYLRFTDALYKIKGERK